MKFGSWAFLVVLLPGIAFAALTNTERKSQFEKAFASIMAAATPQVSTPIRDRLVRDYLDMPLNKAQAVQLADGNYFRASLHEDPSVVGDRTLEACQLRYAKPCALLAINDEIVAEGELISKDMPRLHYAGKYDISQIPIIRLVTKKRPDVQFYDRAMEPKAMAVHPWGKLFISAGNPTSKEAQETALAKCNNDPARNGKDDGCFLYAVNNDVVLAERRMSPK
jgi:hypothetical protein